MEIAIEINQRQLDRALAPLAAWPRQIPRALANAVNKTGDKTFTGTSQEIKAEVNLPAARIKKQMAKARATVSRPAYTVHLKDKRIPLIYFGGRGLKRGISYQIQRGGSREKILYHPDENRVFYQVMKGHKGLFKRKRRTRYPTAELMGPSIGAAFGRTPRLSQHVLRQANIDLVRNVNSQVKWILEKKRGTG